MSFKDIRYILGKRITDQKPSDFPILLIENTGIKMDPTKYYLSATLLPAEPFAAALGQDAEDYLSGIFQLTILGPKGIGTKKIQDYAESLVSTIFSRSLRLSGIINNASTEVVIRKAFIRSAGDFEENVYSIICEIQYYTYAKA